MRAAFLLKEQQEMGNLKILHRMFSWWGQVFI